MTKEIIVYVDATDFAHEIGEGNAPGPHQVYNSIEEILKLKPCSKECGVYKAKLSFVEVALSGENSNTVYDKHVEEDIV